MNNAEPAPYKYSARYSNRYGWTIVTPSGNNLTAANGCTIVFKQRRSAEKFAEHKTEQTANLLARYK